MRVLSKRSLLPPSPKPRLLAMRGRGQGREGLLLLHTRLLAKRGRGQGQEGLLLLHTSGAERGAAPSPSLLQSRLR